MDPNEQPPQWPSNEYRQNIVKKIEQHTRGTTLQQPAHVIESQAFNQAQGSEDHYKAIITRIINSVTDQARMMQQQHQQQQQQGMPGMMEGVGPGQQMYAGSRGPPPQFVQQQYQGRPSSQPMGGAQPLPAQPQQPMMMAAGQTPPTQYVGAQQTQLRPGMMGQRPGGPPYQSAASLSNDQKRKLLQEGLAPQHREQFSSYTPEQKAQILESLFIKHQQQRAKRMNEMNQQQQQQQQQQPRYHHPPMDGYQPGYNVPPQRMPTSQPQPQVSAAYGGAQPTSSGDRLAVPGPAVGGGGFAPPPGGSRLPGGPPNAAGVQPTPRFSGGGSLNLPPGQYTQPKSVPTDAAPDSTSSGGAGHGPPSEPTATQQEDEQAYQAKLDALRQYIEPVKRMIERNHIDDVQNSRLEKLLEIMERKRARVKMELLDKALTSTKLMVENSSLCKPLVDAVNSTVNAGHSELFKQSLLPDPWDAYAHLRIGVSGKYRKRAAAADTSVKGEDGEQSGGSALGDSATTGTTGMEKRVSPLPYTVECADGTSLAFSHSLRREIEELRRKGCLVRPSDQMPPLSVESNSAEFLISAEKSRFICPDLPVVVPVDYPKSAAVLSPYCEEILVQHTSASICLNENWDSSVRSDAEMALNHIVPEKGLPYQHTLEGPDDMPAHVKSALVGASISVPIADGQFKLGTWQGIWLCEHRNRAGPRHIVVTIQGAPKQ